MFHAKKIINRRCFEIYAQIVHVFELQKASKFMGMFLRAECVFISVMRDSPLPLCVSNI